MICKICNKPLKNSQYSKDRTYKSCPKCSTINGEEHVFFPYPQEFGTTTLRETAVHPDGPQSYCVKHRGNPNASVPSHGIFCSKMR